ncbi:tail fiber domain-containing protein [Nostoc sp. CHAB 5715]|uniref:tail fiber domain-containing protein n=1 Tax=Nostoc sp. CHAB 5715 TaxID=2780400 RepID=UPI001E62E50E|nr:tail fiber domain-containing protein [Nostoc sp. CHAB 5715]MCC5625457.1 tail fiber domain-containing protein [Nostoc sp. CHAB 5715]
MSNNFSRNQILKATSAFIVGAAATKILGDEPAQAQQSQRIFVSNNLDLNFPQIQIRQTQEGDFARLRFNVATFAFWDIAVGPGNNSVMNFFSNLTNNNVMSLNPNGNVSITGALIQGSSKKLKENITELSSKEALETLKDLNPVKFKYKADTEKTHHIGFIAEDVPELVATPDKKGLSSMDIVGVLTKVVQEQQKTILALSEKVRALEDKNVKR